MKKFIINRKGILILSLVLLLLISTGFTFALMSDFTDQVVNNFEPGDVTIEINEDFDGEIKEHVTIKNTSETNSAYIRAYYIVTWKNAAGEIYPVSPVQGQDYIFRFGSNANWDLETSDGYYYYALPIAPGKSTPDFIRECSPIAGRTPAGYHLEVDIIADAIQADPVSTVISEWGVTYSGGKISK